MKVTMKHTILATLFALALPVLAGCGESASAPSDELAGDRAGSSYAGNFVGKVEGTDAFVAVVVDKQHHALAYLCDGKKVAEWFRGAVALDGALDLRSEGGTRLLAEVAKSGVKGTLALEGGELAFSAEPAKGKAGLYRAEETIKGEEYVGGWILLESGQERGAIKNTSTGFIDPLDDLARPSRPVNGFVGSGVEF